MPVRDESAKADATSAPALRSNQWVTQLRVEAARGDQAEAALLAVQDAAAEVMLIALADAQALMDQARDTAQDLLSGAEDEAKELLEVARLSARLLASRH